MDAVKEKKRVPYDYNVATLPAESVDAITGRTRDMEETSSRTLAIYDRKAKDIVAVVSAHWFMGRSRSASTVYCDVRIRTRDRARYFTGTGSASGCGYHKASAAFGSAVRNAGVTLRGNVEGCGDRAIDLAIEAIGRACGYPASAVARIL